MSEQLPDVGADHFGALDLRVARVLAVAPFPAARRPAYQLRLDLGPLGERQSSAQLTHYDAEQLEGRLVVVAVNLGPRRIAGFRSECLVLGSVGAGGLARLLTPEAGAAPGDRVA